ncbi:hypothetical protein ACFSTE_11855 [Aquimarina hainanensis]|uniref:Uncharacterized protein n=1 Tax=Aquimarina hainanensis TaxID=1578017 RepID=A0ABW5N921_9FLAO
MEANRLINYLFLFGWLYIGIAQENNTEAFRYKLDYSIPESPAFAVLDANPTTVLRATAAQEVITQLATNFISGNNVSPGLAIDFNPYFNFGGRLQNIEEYRTKYWSRFLANLQLSLATINATDFPDDMLFSGGLRMTLWDSKDILYNKALGESIDRELLPKEDPGPHHHDPGTIVENNALKIAYEKAKKAYRQQKGGALSIGYAVAGRARNNAFKTDSIITYRHQAWISGQYDFGKNGISINSMLMYRYQHGNLSNSDGVIGGIALRKYGEKLIISSEIYHNGQTESINFGAYAEAYLIPNITLFASLKKEVNAITGEEEVLFKPGIKWNLSESKK